MLDDSLASVREQWEQRATQSGDRPSGVLFHGLSTQANAAIHRWHEWVVAQVFLSRLREGATVLDLGCGYGRLSRTIHERRPDLHIVGQDMSHVYCRRFRDNVGACVQADAHRLPFVTGSFDAVMAVTCLMYGARASVPDLLVDVRRVLRSRGTLLLLDPGYELQKLIQVVRPRREQSPTGGAGFTVAEYPALLADCHFIVDARGGNPWTSGALLMPGVGRSHSPWSARLINRVAIRDCRVAGYSRFALHRWVLATRSG